MVDIQALINKGYQQAAFKYKANAVKFMRAWQKKGYYVDYLLSSGPVVDDDKRCPSAYYVVAEKNKPKPYTKKQQREIAEYNRLEKWNKTDPRGYWRGYVRSGLMKRTSELDPEIRDLIFELNDHDQFTISSCAGHGTMRGHIFFKRDMFDGNKARAIMKKHGLTGITKDPKPYIGSDGTRYHVYEFDPVGRANK